MSSPPPSPRSDRQQIPVAERRDSAVDHQKAVVALPVGFRVELDPVATQLRPGLWYAAGRVVRLTPSGREVWERLRRDGVTDHPTGRLARRLTDAGVAHPVPPPSASPDVTVVIPVHDRVADLDRCLTALGPSRPVVVVDDASADELGTRAVAHRHGARLARLAHNRGPAAARNAGLALATTDLVAFLDSDTATGPDWIDELAPHLADPGVAAVAPRVVALRPAPRAGNLDLGTARAIAAPYGRVGYVPTAALLARRADLGAVGGFDETLRTGEDVDLVWRLRARGLRVRYEPGVRVAHDEPSGLGRLARRHAYGRSAAPLALRHPDSLAPFALHPWYAAAAAALARRSPLLALAASAGALLGTGRALRRADVPTTGLPLAVARGIGQTYLGAARCGVQFAAPVLAATPARIHLLAPGLVAWWPYRREIDPLRFVLGHLADEIAYGSGVLVGCARHRTARPLRPKIVRRSA